MDPRLVSALKQYRARFPGQEDQWQRLRGWLLDYAADQRPASIALSAVAKLGLHDELAQFSSHDRFSRFVDQLTEVEALPRFLAEEALLAWLDELGREPPEKAALLGPIDDGLIAASLDGTDCLHLALALANLPAAQVRIESRTPQVLRNLTVSVWLKGEEPARGLSSTTWTAGVDRLLGHQIALLDGVNPRVDTQALRTVTGTDQAQWWIEVQAGDTVVLRTYQTLNVLPPRRWLMGLAPPPVLAAFVLPKSPIVAELVAEAAGRVDPEDPRPATVKAHEALERVLAESGLGEPKGWRNQVVGPRTLVERGQASLVEYQLLIAACLEHGGMPSMLLWSAGRPALGLWLSDDQPSLIHTDDPTIIERLDEAGALKVLPVGSHQVELSQSAGGGDFCALDLGSVRARVPSLPLETLEETSPATSGAPPDGLRQRLLDRAALATPASGLRLRGAWSAQLNRRLVVTEELPERVESWKRRLLNLTLLNPLLNLRDRVTTLPLMIADVGTIEDQLASGKGFDLVSRPPAPRPGQPLPEVTAAMMEKAMRAGKLIVDLPDKRLERGAKKALRNSRTAHSEGGVNTLFLALGILHWIEPGKAGKERFAPLLMVPVKLERVGQGPYRVDGAEGDTEFNAALLEYLRRKLGLEVPGLYPLPLDHSGVDVPAILDELRKALDGNPATAGWRVKEEAQIAILSFSGYRMWRDLDQRSADLLRHPLVRRLALHGESQGEQVEFPQAASLDDAWDPAEVFCPLEADSSQLVAIRAATDGLSFALEGPPGTGKSQTIANLICHCLAIGRTVLFVSQKRAALEVVQAKLEDVGLGPFTLDLHSHKASKPEFIEQFRVAARFRARRPRAEWAKEAAALADARRQLNKVVRAVHRERRPNRLTAFEAAVELDALGDVPTLLDDFDQERAFDAGWLAKSDNVMVRLGPELQRLGAARGPLDAVRTTDWPAVRRRKLAGELAALRQAASDLETACAVQSPWHPGLERADAENLQLVDQLLEETQSSPRPTQALLAGGEDEVTSWLGHLERAMALASGFDRHYQPTLLDQPLEEHEAFLRTWAGVPVLGWLMSLWLRRQYLTVVKKPPVPQAGQLLPSLKLALELRDKKRIVDSRWRRMTELLGPLKKDPWGLPVIDLEATRTLLDWSRKFRARATSFPAFLVVASRDAPDGAAATVDGFRVAYATFTRCCRQAGDTLQLAGEWAPQAAPAYCASVRAHAEELRSLTGSLRDWGAYSRTRKEALELGHDRLVQALEDGRVTPEELPRAFRKSWLRGWFDHWSEQDPALASYDGNQQQDRERHFGNLDVRLRQLVQGEVLARLSARQPHLDEAAPASSEAGILRRQFRKRTGFASPRLLFEKCPKLIRQLKPCVLMSPQSVAQYLDPLHPPFDLVVFDEASQVPVYEAIGAIARGKQVIVVGDSKQLPPTMFFKDRDQESVNDDDLMVELDSILTECRVSGLDSLELAWHYRSRHPSLIAFSNRRYYRNRLQVLPAALAHAPHLGVSRCLVPNAIYDRGGAKVNRVEAEALVRSVVRRLMRAADHLERDPEARPPSLGVVTFSSTQQMLVEDLLEAARASQPVIEQFFDGGQPEPVFVKNLENVQGDERDVILFSIGYGPDHRGRMTANLGPLGNEGGERRLNVAITRARQQLVVFVSFEPDELDLSRTSAKGLHDLKAFLDSAAVGGEALVGSEEPKQDPVSSALKNALAERLREAGHEVDVDLGVGAYRLDLAVRDRQVEGAFVMGIEVDDRRYAETPTARERDRLRWQVLRGLGWRHLYRMRGLEWCDDPERTVSEVLEVLERSGEGEIPPGGLEPAEPVLLAADPDGPEELVERGDAAFVDAPRNRTTYQTAATYRRWSPRKRPARLELKHPSLPRLVAKVVELEGPVSQRLISRRIVDAWRLKRTPTGLAEEIGGIVARIDGQSRPRQHGEFLWPREIDPERWRGYRVPEPEKPASSRQIADIPLEELANAADDLRVRYPGTPEDELARAVARVFGFRVLNRPVRERIEAGVRLAEARQAR